MTIPNQTNLLTPGVLGIPASTGANANSAALASQSSNLSTDNPITDPVKTFLDYMKETPAQRFEDQWLGAHHLTSADLAKMSPAERKKIEREIQQDIKASLEKSSDAKLTQAGLLP